MKIALDFNDIITEDPKVFRDLARAVIKDGGEVYVVSAIEKKNEMATRARLRGYNIPTTEVIFIHFEDYYDVPKLKLAVLKQKRIDLLIDDNPKNRKLAMQHHIYCLCPEQK